jgi:hypothetical protein
MHDSISGIILKVDKIEKSDEYIEKRMKNYELNM